MSQLLMKFNSNFRKLKNFYFPGEIRFSHKWTIEKFDTFLNKTNPWKGPLYSECFSPLDSEQLQFHFRLNPNGSNERDYLSIDIVIRASEHQQPKCNDKLKCKLNILILNENQELCYGKVRTFVVNTQKIQTIDKFIKISDLSRPAYLQNNKLNLKFKIKLLANDDSLQNIKCLPVGESRISEAAKVTHLEYKWTIANCDGLFSDFDFDDDDELEQKQQQVSPLFIQSNYLSENPQSDHHKLKLKLYPKGLNYDDSREFVDIELCTDSSNMHFMVNAKIEILGTRKVPQEISGLICIGKPIVFRNYIKQKDLINLVKSQKHFIVKCEFTHMTCNKLSHEDGFNDANIKTELERQLDAAKTLAYYTKQSYDIAEFMNGQKLKKFSLETESNQTFSLNAKNENINSDWLSVCLNLFAKYDNILQGTVQYAISLLDQSGQKCYSKEWQVNSLSCKESFGFKEYIREAHFNHLKANLRSNGKQITKLLVEFWVNTKIQNSSSENVEFFKSAQNGSVTNIYKVNNSIFNHNSKLHVNGAVSLAQKASSSSKRQPLNTVHFE